MTRPLASTDPQILELLKKFGLADQHVTEMNIKLKSKEPVIVSIKKEVHPKEWDAISALVSVDYVLMPKTLDVSGLIEGNWAHPDSGRIVGWRIMPEDVDRIEANAFCLPREIGEALKRMIELGRS